MLKYLFEKVYIVVYITPTFMELQTKRLLLRDFVSEDASAVYEHINNLNVSKYLSKVKFPYTLEDAEEFIEKKLVAIDAAENGKEPRTDYSLAIIKQSDQGLMGCIGLHNVNDFVGTATLGYWLGEPFWGNGYATEAAARVRDFAFEDLNLQRINVDALIDNPGSNRVIRKIGGKFECKRQRAVRPLSTGELCDINQYGILR
ncbi:MAG: GNAT family N-acetyltransferase [bacterium]